MDQATRRRALWDLAQRGVQVFVAALLVELAAGDLWPRLYRLDFWRDLLGAAAVAVVAQLFAWLAIEAAHHHD